MKRRNLLRITAAGAGMALAAPLLGRAQAALAGKKAIVVGSGFGGAVAAYRLGQAGVQTTVLERGRRWDADGSGTTFCTVSSPDWRCGWFEDHPPLGLDVSKPIARKAGLIAKHRGDGINVLSGTGVGGGSLVMGMFMPQPRQSEWTMVYPAELSYQEMDSIYWPRARKHLGVSTLPDDISASPQYRGARAWLEYASEFRKTPEPIPFATDWDVIRRELTGTAPACHTIGEGPFGSNSGAKHSVDRNYLRWASATGNVAIEPLHEVTEIHEVPGNDGFEVRCKQLNEHGDVLGTKTLHADYLFMAAGSLYTTSLLVTARARGWLPRLRDVVGTGFGNNGDFLVVRLNLRKDVGHAQSGPGNVRFFDDNNPYAKTAMAWEAAPVPSWIGRASAHLIVSITPERGEIRYDPATGSGKVYWPFEEMQTKSEQAGRNLATRLWWKTEGEKGYPFSGLPGYDRSTGHGLGAANTWHPLGGMVMGKATDFGGRSLDYPNLYCVDGSVLPGSTCLANPALTITANAERCMDAFIAAHA